MIKKSKFWFWGIMMFIILPFSLAAFKSSQAQTSGSTAAEADAIAVRVVPNPNHYSIVRWYESQGFSGAPQALTVDGYEAVRDGRTVYVNAANIDTAGRSIYTNIYLISYNQDSTSKTVDILGQIVAHWKFNNNLDENSSSAPTCAIAAQACNLAADCAANQYCATSSAGIASSSCQLVTPVNCLVDSDCPGNFFCNSIKSKITRDIKRLGRLEELKAALFNFRQRNNYYPRLSAGTYLANNSLSVWPSWAQSLLSDVAVSQNISDPINRLGPCPGYEAETCWNAALNKFVSSPSGGILTLPAGSYAFAYSTDANGTDYNLCAVLESRSTDLDYHFLPAATDPTSSACVSGNGIIASASAGNTVPVLVDKFLIGQANQEFSGFLKVIDAENNPLTWSISGPSWVSLQSTSDPTQKKVYASSAATPGIYNLSLTVSDGQGGVLSTTTQITILADAPRIAASDVEYVLDPTVPFNYNFTFSSKNLTVPATAYKVTRTSGLPDILNSIGLSDSFATLAGNNYQVTYTGIIPTSRKFYQDTNVNYRIDLKDKNNITYPKTFNVRIIVDQPQLNFACPTQARVGNTYTCLLGAKAQGNHTLSYSASGLPTGLALSGTSDISIAGKTSLGALTNYNVNIKATNEYGASTSRAFVLKLNNYCGDGQLQSPNTEGRGGINNDGYEDCDGTRGVIYTAETSSTTAQYGCRTEVGSSVPNPIFTNTYCVFKSPTEGGGYCGDTYCQVSVNGKTMETCSNCPQDCGTCPCVPNCTNNPCGDNGCGNVCGFCNADNNEVCVTKVLDDSSHAEINYCCTPIDCESAGKVCGDDGCGGICGLCKGDSLCNAAGTQCCPKDAEIQTSVDDYQTTYFNGVKVSTTENACCGKNCSATTCVDKNITPSATNMPGCCWKQIQKYNVTVQPGKNVIAIKAIDAGGNYGLAATLNQAPCNSMTTSETTNWKCTGVAQNETAWTGISFNDSSWPSASSTNQTSGNALAPSVGQIWARGYGQKSTIYCRYTFYSQVSSAQ